MGADKGKEVESVYMEKRVFEPSKEFVKNALLKSMAEYKKLYKKSINDPQTFWGEMAEEHLDFVVVLIGLRIRQQPEKHVHPSRSPVLARMCSDFTPLDLFCVHSGDVHGGTAEDRGALSSPTLDPPHRKASLQEPVGELDSDLKYPKSDSRIWLRIDDLRSGHDLHVKPSRCPKLGHLLHQA
jgi:hypothetical protein